RGLNNNFYYLTGMKDRGATLILLPEGDIKEILFNASGTWDYAASNSLAEVFRAEDFSSTPIRYIGSETLYMSFRNFDILDGLGRGINSIKTIKNVDPVLVNMRIFKDEKEIEFLKKAGVVTALALNDAYKAAEPGVTENQLFEIMENGIKSRGSRGSSFYQVASGPNAVNVHFNATDRPMEEGDLIVFDYGAWWENYTADISRTIPVSGKFTIEQKEIYQIVLASQKAAINKMKPGVSFNDVRQAAEEVIIDGLTDLGLITDKSKEWQQRFYIQHGFYHFIGLEIHDVWSEYRNALDELVYQPGMIMTMEPGLYFPEDYLDRRQPRGVEAEEWQQFLQKVRPIYNKYIHIGVRIEDDVLITANGNEVLTSQVPKEIADIENMMKKQ
ncbi:M24 family metallopeptidase, partial [candidate division KSB1 bacterium]